MKKRIKEIKECLESAEYYMRRLALETNYFERMIHFHLTGKGYPTPGHEKELVDEMLKLYHEALSRCDLEIHDKWTCPKLFDRKTKKYINVHW